jgi:hypothetical protein
MRYIVTYPNTIDSYSNSMEHNNPQGASDIPDISTEMGNEKQKRFCIVSLVLVRSDTRKPEIPIF